MSFEYFDAEWLGVTGAVPLVVEDDGTVRFRSRTLSAPPEADPDVTALRAFGSLADAVARILEPETASRLEVTGDGIVAGLVRAAVASRDAEDAPDVVVDTTGDPTVVADATRRLRSLGLLVLAGESFGRSMDLDLYPDVHVRGLRIAATGPLLSHPLPEHPPSGAPASGWHRVER